MDNISLAHSKWNCKYHVVFVFEAKYRREIIYRKVKANARIENFNELYNKNKKKVLLKVNFK